MGFKEHRGAGPAGGVYVASGSRRSEGLVTFQGPSLVLRNPERAGFALHKVGSLGGNRCVCTHMRVYEGENLFF